MDVVLSQTLPGCWPVAAVEGMGLVGPSKHKPHRGLWWQGAPWAQQVGRAGCHSAQHSGFGHAHGGAATMWPYAGGCPVCCLPGHRVSAPAKGAEWPRGSQGAHCTLGCRFGPYLWGSGAGWHSVVAPQSPISLQVGQTGIYSKLCAKA